MQLPKNFPFSWQAVSLSLLVISQDPHCYHLWSWIEIPHHAGKTKRCLDEIFWLFLGGFCQNHLSLNCIIPHIHASITLPETYKKVKVGAHFIDLWFAEFFILSSDCV